MPRSSTSVPSLVGKGVSSKGVKGDMGMRLFKDCSASGVEGVFGQVIWVVNIGDAGGSRALVSFIGAVGCVSSVILGKSSISVAFKVLPSSLPTSVVEDVSSGLASNLAIRNFSSRSFEGERERFGDGGGFLKSIRGISLKDAKRGTDWALPFLGVTGDGVGLVETGFLVVVAERFLVERFPVRTAESERLRACPRVERW